MKTPQTPSSLLKKVLPSRLPTFARPLIIFSPSPQPTGLSGVAALHAGKNPGTKRPISIGYGAGSIDSDATNCIIIGTNSNCGSGTSNTILMGTGSTTGVNNKFYLPQIGHFNIPALTTLADGTGILLQYGGANADWVEALGGTYNSVEKIDTIISTIQGQLPAEIIFTTTSTDPPNVTWTVPAGVNSVTIKASGSGAPAWVLLLLLRAHQVSTKEEVEAAVGR